jgi:hypothetical protein
MWDKYRRRGERLRDRKSHQSGDTGIVFLALRAGKLTIHKDGRRSYVTADELQRYIGAW